MDNYVNVIVETAKNYGESIYRLEREGRISPEKADRLKDELRYFVQQQIKQAQLDVFSQMDSLFNKYLKAELEFGELRERVNELGQKIDYDEEFPNLA